jgi:hypothetical protein
MGGTSQELKATIARQRVWLAEIAPLVDIRDAK